MILRIVQLAFVVALGGMLGFLGLGSVTTPAPSPASRVSVDAAPPPAPAAPVALSAPPDDLEPDDDAPISEAERLNREAVARANTGDFAGAAALLRDAVRLEPSHALYRGNLQAVLINAGFAAIDAEDFDRAVGWFVEVLGLEERSEARRGLGYAYYRLGKLDLARQNLERVLDAEAGDAETYLTLGRIHLEQRDHARAREMLERARVAGADQPGLADTIERLRRDAEAEQGFHALASSHFVLKFEGRENTQAGRLVLNALEEAYRTVGARFAYYPLERIEVVLYPDETFRAVTNSPHWSGAVYDGRIKMPIGGLERGSERLKRTLRHEYAHAAIVTLSRGKAPVWLNEGLAQVAEEPSELGRLNRLRLGLAADALLPLADLERDFTAFDRDQASLAYAQAYFAARYLLEKKGAYNVRRLLEALATATSIDSAFQQTLSESYEVFERHVLIDLARQVG
jgi:tetratricopeptide (TPR) repeat protein